MPGVKMITSAIRDRLTELEHQLEPLRAEWQVLTNVLTAAGTSPTPPGRPATPKGARAASRPRRTTESTAPGPGRRSPATGGRAQQALREIGQQPGITAAELAAATGTAPNYLYRLLPPLERKGVISKQNGGYHLAGETPPGPASVPATEDAS
jgi:predicted Rossmann fold nucleotide-binding protein DprA/Smf involved in DNA uptake